MTTPVRSAPSASATAPPITPPASGLVSLARQPDDGDDRWMAGYAYRTELPSAARNRSQNTATIGANVVTDPGPEFVDTIPIALTVQDDLSTFSFDVEDPEDRVTRILEAYTSKLLERELWTGEIAVADGLPNRVLATAGTTDITPGTPPSPQTAVGLLIDSLSDAGMGDGMIHAGKSTGIRLPDAWKNEDTYERYGFVVVSGAGYPGTGPAGTGTGWMFATEIVNVRLGPIFVTPGVLPESINRSDNTITYYAQRFAAADFSGPVFACQISPT